MNFLTMIMSQLKTVMYLKGIGLTSTFILNCAITDVTQMTIGILRCIITTSQ